MRTPLPLVLLLFLALGAAARFTRRSPNPIPAPIVKRGLSVEIRDVVRLPDTRGLRPADQDVVPAGWARVSFVRDLPDGRRFANDSRGLLYLLDRNNQPSVYANVGAAFPFAIYNRLESGFIGFDFHPEFARNGLFYTVHAERAMGNPATPNFIPPGFTPADVDLPQRHHGVARHEPGGEHLRGHQARAAPRRPTSSTNLTHPFGDVEFNPTAKPGAPDYGLLYTSGSDLGFSNGGGPNANNPGQTQRLDTVIGAILRIDPRSPSVSGGTKGLGDYTIPPVNKFAADGDPKTLGEIYAYGFRNAHRLSWDLTDGTMFASDIGMNHIEEINIVRDGDNYGWMKREGLFENGMTTTRRRAQPAVPAAGGDPGRADEGRVHLPGGDLRPQRRAGRDRRIRLPRPHSRAPRQVRLRRHRPRTAVRGRPRGDEEGRRRDSADRGAGRRDPAVRARRGRQPRRT